MNDLEHPDITSALNTGYPSGYDDSPVVCPVCGSDDCETIYVTKWGEAVGCDQCLLGLELWEYVSQVETVYS